MFFALNIDWIYIQPTLIPHLIEEKDSRLEREKRSRLIARKARASELMKILSSELSLGQSQERDIVDLGILDWASVFLIPSDLDLCALPAVRDLVEDDGEGKEDQTGNVIDDGWVAMQSQILLEVRAWQRSAQDQLVERLHFFDDQDGVDSDVDGGSSVGDVASANAVAVGSHSLITQSHASNTSHHQASSNRSHESTLTLLGLATSIFELDSAKNSYNEHVPLLSYPSVFHTPSPIGPFYVGYRLEMSDYYGRTFDQRTGIAYRLDRVVVNDDVAYTAMTLLKALGQDFRSTTHATMNAIGKEFVCMSCDPQRNQMSWLELVSRPIIIVAWL